VSIKVTSSERIASGPETLTFRSFIISLRQLDTNRPGGAPTAIAIASSGTDWRRAGIAGQSPPLGSGRDAARSVQQRRADRIRQGRVQLT
jgi:hypothetical protein